MKRILALVFIVLCAWTPAKRAVVLTQNPCDFSRYPGITLWLDAQASGTMTLVSSTHVSAWASRVKVFSFTQSTDVNRPIYNATALNSLPAVTSTNAQYMGASTTNASLFSAKALTFIMVTNPQDVTTYAPTLIMSSDSNFQLQTGYVSGKINFNLNNGHTGGQVVITTAPSIIAAYYDGSYASIAVNNGTPNAPAYSTPLTLTGTLILGYPGSNATTPNYGGEIIAANQAWSSGRIKQAQRCLATKWGITLVNGGV